MKLTQSERIKWIVTYVTQHTGVTALYIWTKLIGHTHFITFIFTELSQGKSWIKSISTADDTYCGVNCLIVFYSGSALLEWCVFKVPSFLYIHSFPVQWPLVPLYLSRTLYTSCDKARLIVRNGGTTTVSSRWYAALAAFILLLSAAAAACSAAVRVRYGATKVVPGE